MSIKQPISRAPCADITNPVFDDLINLALQRMRYIVGPKSGNPPPTLFPLAEGMRGQFFTVDDWDEFGDLETEYGRLNYTLSKYPERGAPAAAEETIQKLLEATNVLTEWPTVVPALNTHAKAALDDVYKRQRGEDGFEPDFFTKADYNTIPVDYQVSQNSSELSLKLWKRALREVAMTLADGRRANGVEFLQIHSYLKDPIYGLKKPTLLQQFFFANLLDSFKSQAPSDALSQEDWKKIAAQAAQESSYLSSPLLNKITLIHFNAHHQLPYAYVSIDSLARAEFSVPKHVLEVAEEIILAAVANGGKAFPIVPILVTSRPSFFDSEKNITPIIDGVHRVTAIHLLRFLAEQSILSNKEKMCRKLVEYCNFHNLGRKWQVDLLDVLSEFYSSRGHWFYDHLLANYQLLSRFAAMKYVPALVVQEEDFYTVDKQRSLGKAKPMLLHPLHQTLFNDELPFALPQKAGQTHGRPNVFKLLPLRPFGLAEEELGIEIKKEVSETTAVRVSMVGL